MIEIKSERELSQCEDTQMTPELGNGDSIDIDAFTNLKFAEKGPDSLGYKYTYGLKAVDQRALSASGLSSDVPLVTSRFTNLSLCVKGGFAQICVIESTATAYKTAVVKYADKVFTLSVTFRYDKAVPVVYGLFAPEINMENKHTVRRRLQTQFYASVGRLVTESQDLSGYHFSVKHVTNRPYGVSLKKIDAIGKDVVAEIMNVLDSEYITIPMI